MLSINFFKEHKNSIFIIIISFILCLILTTCLGLFLYNKIPKQTNDILNTGNIVVIKDYYITGTDNNINKHVYIILDKDTKLMYINIDTIQNGKVMASSQSELYNKKQSIMTYMDYLNEIDDTSSNLNLNNKVKMDVPTTQKSNSNDNSK